jgi:hypothetical protein
MNPESSASFQAYLSLMIRTAVVLAALLLATGCGNEKLPAVPAVPDSIKDIPGAQAVLDELPDAFEDLELPDISQIADLPQLVDLPATQSPPGGIVFNGPTEFRLRPGETIPGTDIRFVAVTDEGAEFSIANMRSIRTIGDSLDFDGNWPSIDGATYNLRTRIYRIGSGNIRAAGVHQLTVEHISPAESDVGMGDHTTRFLYSSGAPSGERFDGMTLGYVGTEDRGGELSGLPVGDYPYRKVGDSIAWQGQLRADIPVEYAARMLLYGESSARIGGVVKVSLPNN